MKTKRVWSRFSKLNMGESFSMVNDSGEWSGYRKTGPETASKTWEDGSVWPRVEMGAMDRVIRVVSV